MSVDWKFNRGKIRLRKKGEREGEKWNFGRNGKESFIVMNFSFFRESFRVDKTKSSILTRLKRLVFSKSSLVGFLKVKKSKEKPNCSVIPSIFSKNSKNPSLNSTPLAYSFYFLHQEEIYFSLSLSRRSLF